MLRNYLTAILRTLRFRPAYALINVVGLMLGCAAALLIGLYVRHEFSYDRFHAHADDVYRIAWMDERPQTRTPHPMAQAMVRDFPDVEAATSLTPLWGPGLTRPTYSVRYRDRRFEETEILGVDSTFFDVFTFPARQGNPAAALREPGMILITESMADKYFGDADPLGKSLTFNDAVELTVGAVLEDVPDASHFHFDFLISYVTLKPQETGGFYTWEDFGHYNYIRLADNTDPDRIEERIRTWIPRYIDVSAAGMEAMQAGRIGFALQPLTRIHLHSHLRWELEPTGYAAYLYIFSVAALLILGIACVNVTNLGTARAMERAREVGVRKTLGARQGQLIRQYLGESILLSGLAVGAALLLVRGLLPVFNPLIGTELSLLDLGLVPLALGGVVLALLVGGAAGGYPALYLARLHPARVLKGHGADPAGGRRLRRGLVVVQFAASIVLLAGALVIHDQVQYLRQAELGFDAEQVVVVPLTDETLRSRSQALIDEVEQQAGVVRAAAVSNVPGGRFNQNPVRWQGRTVDMAEWRVAPNTVETLGLTLAAGRGFRRDAAADVEQAFLVNEAAVQAFGWEDAISREVVWADDEEEIRGTIIGVLEDFHFASLRQAVPPLIVQVRPSEFNYLLVRIEADAAASTLAALENVWEGFAADRTFDYAFLDQQVDAQYRAEARIQAVVAVFAIVAIGVAALGLFGLTALTVVRRRKEVGIRKALGATTAGLTVRLGADFVRLVGWAFLVATPVTYGAARSWLAHFAYRIDLGPKAFVLAGLGVAVVAALTVAVHAVRAASADPARVLHSE